jgi:hypothetical protein
VAKFYGEVHDGKVRWSSPELLRQYIAQQEEGLAISMEIKPVGKDITAEQWGYYYGAIVRRFIKNGEYDSPQEVDGLLCKALLTVNKGTGKEYVRSKTDLNRKELSDFIEGAIRIASFAGLIVEPPNPAWKRDANKPAAKADSPTATEKSAKKKKGKV